MRTRYLIGAAGIALAAMSSGALAETYVMVTHTAGTDPFWPVVQTAAEDAAAALGVTLDYQYPANGDLVEMARIIEAASGRDIDGLIVSLPDADVLGAAIKGVAAAGVPVITINSGLERSAEVGALMHVGQPESLAGEKAGALAKAAGVGHAFCTVHEAFNLAIQQRCQGYFAGLGATGEIIDVTSDPAEQKARIAARLTSDPTLQGVMASGAEQCASAMAAIKEVGAKVHLSCFDLSPQVIDGIKSGEVAFTVDQQQYLQGYLPVVVLHLYNTNAQMLPGANIPSGPGIVDASNADGVAALAGITR